MRLDQRGAGILLHISSLPGPHATGDLGAGARAFVDWLAAAGQRWWQVLPVNPAGVGDSPYSGASAFAGDPMLISLVELVEDGLLEPAELPPAVEDGASGRRTDHARARQLRAAALARAFARFRPGREYERFHRDSAHWLPDYALFEALRAAHPGAPWTAWPEAIRRREPAALERARRDHADTIARTSFIQFVFAQQWARLRLYARERGVGLIGDIPIFVAHDSADVWAHPQYFALDDAGAATEVSGVPPDYFSETGQRWGNPQYRWKRLARDGYRWWIDRVRTLLDRFDVIRLDHFIGFCRYWSIPASEETAVHGRWVKGPRDDFFRAVRAQLGDLPFIAEDLGEVTPAVRVLRDRFGLPGMRVFQFGFGSDVQAAEFQPHRYPRRAVAYSGTHDNDTIMGWFDDDGADGPRSPEQAAAERAAAIAYLAGPGATALPGPAHLEILRALYASVADTVIVPMQDVLGLGNQARMNRPGVADGNWAWRVDPGALTPAIANHLRALARLYGRLYEETTDAA